MHDPCLNALAKMAIIVDINLPPHLDNSDNGIFHHKTAVRTAAAVTALQRYLYIT